MYFWNVLILIEIILKITSCNYSKDFKYVIYVVMQFEKNTFVFFEKNCFLWRKKHGLRKKHWKSVFFVFFYKKLCIKEKRKVVFLIWGPGDPVCPREVKLFDGLHTLGSVENTQLTILSQVMNYFTNKSMHSFHWRINFIYFFIVVSYFAVLYIYIFIAYVIIGYLSDSK